LDLWGCGMQRLNQLVDEFTELKFDPVESIRLGFVIKDKNLALEYTSKDYLLKVYNLLFDAITKIDKAQSCDYLMSNIDIEIALSSLRNQLEHSLETACLTLNIANHATYPIQR